MNRCPITYEPCGDALYSAAGLKRLSKSLTTLNLLPFDTEGLRREAMLRASHISIQGVQPKLSAIIDTRRASFALTDKHGRYILKPQAAYPELPQNEDLTMRLAAEVGIEVPFHGLVYAQDRSMVYFIQRFDRVGRRGKVPLEDFAQLAGRTRETKYDFSMEKIVDLIDRYCTFPVVERLRLFERVIFNFLVGNETCISRTSRS